MRKAELKRKILRHGRDEWFLSPITGPTKLTLAELNPGGDAVNLRAADSNRHIATYDAWPCPGPQEALRLAQTVMSGHPEIGFIIISRNSKMSRVGRVISRVNAETATA